MSPEQMRSARDVDARTDIWSIGTMLFEALTGNPPFAGESVPQICAALLNDPPPPMSEFRPDVPVVLEEIIVRCLAKNREQRWDSVGALANALAPYAPPSARLHATRANRSNTTDNAAPSPTVPLGAGEAAPKVSRSTDTLDPPDTTVAPASPTLASSPAGAHSDATVNSWGTTGSGKRSAGRVLWFAVGGALFALLAIGALLVLKRPEDVAVAPVSVLSAPPAASAVPAPVAEIAIPEPPAASAAPTASALLATSHPSASTAAALAHAPPARSSAPKHDTANRPPPGKVEAISDFGGRR